MAKFSLKEIFHKPISGEWGDEPTDDYVEIIKTNNILNFGKIDFSNTTLREVDTQKVESKKLEYGDILVEKSGGSPANPVGRVCFFNKNEGTYLTNNFMSTLRLKNSNFDSKYVFYYLFNLYRKKVVLNFQNQTTGIINFKLDRYLNEISIYQIDLNKQKLIAKTLDKANKLVELRKESITKLDALAKSIFIDMFGDPVSNPKGWEIKKFNDIFIKITDGTHNSPPMCKTGYKYITAKHIKENGINFKKHETYISKEEHEKIFSRCNPKKGDILYIKDGATTGIACINTFDEEFSLLSSVALLKPSHQIKSEYVVSYLNNPSIKNNILLNMAGGAIQRLTIKKIKDINIIIPPLDLQNKFAKIIKKIEEQKSLYTQELEKLQENFDALLQKSFQE